MNVRLLVGTILQFVGGAEPPAVFDPKKHVVRIEVPAPDTGDAYPRALFDIRVEVDDYGVPCLKITSPDCIKQGRVSHGSGVLIQPDASNHVTVLLTPRRF